jgi:DNA polymerase III subunit delta
VAPRGRGASVGVHAIVGDARNGFDSFRAEEALEALLTETIGSDRGEALQVFRGDEATWNRVLDAARTPSLFVPRRAIVVRSAEALKGDAQGVEAFLDDPNPSVALILIAPKPDGRKAVWKRLLDRARVVKAEPLKGRALRARVVDELRRRRLDLDDQATDALIERVGQDLRRLMGEIDKLEAFAAGAGSLTAETVAAVLGRGIAQPLYRLTDALLARKAAEVLALAEEVLDEGEAPPLVLGALYRAIRQVRGAHALGGARASQQEIASRLRMPPFKVPDVLEAARRWPEKDLRRALSAFGQADRRLKTGGEPRVVLSAAVVEACRGGG